MTFKLNISDKGKTYKLESEGSFFIGKKIGEIVAGKEIDSKLEGFELKITGASSKDGFPLIEGVEGVGLKRVLLTRGKGMKQKKPRGLRLRKTVHANLIDENTIQINLSVSKTGARPFDEVFGKSENKMEDKKMEEEQKNEEETKEEEKQEEKADEQPAEEESSEKTEEAPEEEETEESSEEKKEE